MSKGKTVMVFGVFDRLHPGHRYFLREAKKRGQKLIVVVARDGAVRRLKHKSPSQIELERLSAVRNLPYVSEAVLGDAKEGEYDVVKRYHPALICLGYDQKALKRDLLSRIKASALPKIELIRLRAFQPKKYHTSNYTCHHLVLSCRHASGTGDSLFDGVV